ncbi:hypothetical protein E1A91_A11G210100v1 [Gossypium mustelinum]|uniref:Uncharacterized protein n=1 Tax=Gossypium mustelinum TaxID=34275 RepID=A0A5D2X8T8_GOSMU|nr:hypothetical protein E1A91_A11G210100v1 [Gossypium mustelinum]
MEVEEKENEEEEEEEGKRGEEEEEESEDEGTKKVKGSSRKGSSRKSGRDSAEKKEPVTPSSDRPTRERKVVERFLLWLCLPSFHLCLKVFQIGLIGFHLWALLVLLYTICMHYMGCFDSHFMPITRTHCKVLKA